VFKQRVAPAIRPPFAWNQPFSLGGIAGGERSATARRAVREPGPSINPGLPPHGNTAEGAVLQVGRHRRATIRPQNISSRLSPVSSLGRRPPDPTPLAGVGESDLRLVAAPPRACPPSRKTTFGQLHSRARGRGLGGGRKGRGPPWGQVTVLRGCIKSLHQRDETAGGPDIARTCHQRRRQVLLSTFFFLLSRPQAAGERAAPVGTNLPVCPPAARPSSAPGCRASGDPGFVPAKAPEAPRPCLPHQTGQAHVTSVGGAFTHPSRGAGQSWGTATGGVRFARPPANFCDPYRGRRVVIATL
jgi:hypothetical protein